MQDSAPAFAAQAGLIKQRLLSSTVLASDEGDVPPNVEHGGRRGRG